jgi:hypothetical protein
MRSWRLAAPSPVVRRLTLLALLIGAAALWSCYPGEITNIEELDVVATIPNKDSNFATMRFYAMPDSVKAIDSRERKDGDDTGLDPALERLMLDLVAANMDSLGYSRVTEAGAPDSANAYVGVSVILSNGYVIGSSYPWYGYWGCCYGGYPPYWGPGWGPWYPPYTTVGSFEVGTVLIEMIDRRLSDAAIEDSLLVMGWYAGINGLAGSSQQTTSERITTTINQAFEQSPYLATGDKAGGN